LVFDAEALVEISDLLNVDFEVLVKLGLVNFGTESSLCV
jgi:hypothetical protein